MGSVFGTAKPHDVTFTRSEILVTEDVVDRVRSHILDESEPDNEPVKPSPPPQPAPAPVQQKQVEEPVADHTVPISSTISSLGPAPREEDHRRYLALLKRLEEKSEASLEAAEEEYKRVVDRLHAKYIKHSSESCCADAQKVVEDCYRANGQHTLNCSKEVEAFVQCVAAFRAARIHQQGSDTL